ncbi:MAG: DUF308 domain-containing protein [Eubacterium sp.]|nr:DUF308 domain-containing protein [Eubacterium sp.]
MRELFFRVKSLSIITIIFSAVIGIILIMKPQEGVYAISMIVGVSLIVLGITAWISYFFRGRFFFLALMGTILIIGGVVICIAYQAIASIIVLVLGACLIASGIINLFSSFDSRHFLLGTWILSMTMAIIMIALGIVVVMIAPRADALVGVLLGSSLLFYSVMDIIALIEVVQKTKKVKAQVDSAQKEFENAMNQFADEVENNANEFENQINFAAGNAEEIDVDGQDVE